MDGKKIGTFIRECRKKSGLTQKELAQQLSITDRAISKWERGLNCPDISLLQELAQILGVSVVELLKGEALKDCSSINEEDVISSMQLSQNQMLDKIKLVTNCFTIVVVVFFVFYILTTNAMSIYRLLKKYDMKFYDYAGISYPGGQYIKKEPTYDKNLPMKYVHMTEIILNHQGKYTDEEYQKIRNYTKIMQERLEEQQNSKYYQLSEYTNRDFLNFYLSHQNLLTLEINMEELYDILIKYNQKLVSHLLQYKEIKSQGLEEWGNVYTFLEKPYVISGYNPYDYPNVYGSINAIYEKEIMLCNDIIEVGELNES